MSQKHIDALLRVKAELTQVQPFICNWLRKKAMPGHEEIINWIHKSLDGHGTYGSWLAEQSLHQGVWELYLQDKAAPRKAWIDWMIENHHIFDN